MNVKQQRYTNQAEIICSNWEKVIAEAVFKYAGSVYKTSKNEGQLNDAKCLPNM